MALPRTPGAIFTDIPKYLIDQVSGAMRRVFGSGPGGDARAGLPAPTNVDGPMSQSAARIGGALRNIDVRTRVEPWMGPSQPLEPMAPRGDVAGREWDYPVGYNINTRPREYEGLSFEMLRGLADGLDLVRLCIETRKDQMSGLTWDVVPRMKAGQNVRNTEDPRCQALLEFFRSPDRRNTWDNWMRYIMDEMLVTDAVSIYVRRTVGGDVYALEVIDGSTIKPVIDKTGRRPLPPEAAYQQCYSDDTEILTKRGWLKWYQINHETDEFATRSPETKAFEWQKSDGLYVSDFVGEMVCFKSRFVDIKVTPDHRMLVSRLPHALGGNPKRKGEAIISATQLYDDGNISTRIPLLSSWEGLAVGPKSFGNDENHNRLLQRDTAAQNLRTAGLSYQKIADELDISLGSARRSCTLYTERDRLRMHKDTLPVEMSGDDFVAFMGAFLSEGSCHTTHGGVVCVSQDKGGKAYEEYRQLLNRIAPGRVRYVGDSFQIYSRPLVEYLGQFGHAREKWIPEEILNATSHQLGLFWKFYWLGDGDASKDLIFTSSARMADGLQEVAQKIGKSAVVYRTRPSIQLIREGNTVREIASSGMFRVSARTRPEGMISEKEKVQYSGKVWCPTVPNGIVYVRRNGKPAWCGNCLKGIPAINYTSDELLYFPRNIRPAHVYGASPVQQIFTTINIALRREVSKLSFYTEGNIPEALVGVPATWTPDQIRQFQATMDALTADQTTRRRMVFIPAGTNYVPTRPVQTLDPQQDEWFARVICYAFSLPPLPLVQQMNRNTSETSYDAALAEGLGPTIVWLKGVMDHIITHVFGFSDIEFVLERKPDIEDAELEQRNIALVQAGIKSIDEVRAEMGLAPLGMGNAIMTASGPLFIADLVRAHQQGMLAPPMQAPPDAGALGGMAPPGMGAGMPGGPPASPGIMAQGQAGAMPAQPGAQPVPASIPGRVPVAANDSPSPRSDAFDTIAAGIPVSMLSAVGLAPASKKPDTKTGVTKRGSAPPQLLQELQHHESRAGKKHPVSSG